MTAFASDAAAPLPEHPGALSIGRARRSVSVTKIFCYAFSALAVGFLLFMVGLFVMESLPVWRHAGWGYLTEPKWFFRKSLFGSLSMVYGTVVVAAIALAVAAPVGIGAAIFTSEYLPPGLRLTAKIIIELLAGIPSVVYGLLGILFLRDWVYWALTPMDPVSGDTLLTAGLLLGIMVLPTIMTLSDDALRSVPNLQRAAARGLGLNRAETTLFVALPQARLGIVAALLLGLGRALGETIAVFLVVGRQDNQWPQNVFSLRPLLEAGQTLTSKLGGSETNIAYGSDLHWAAVVTLALLLLAMVGLCTVVADRLLNRQ
jgi:phosphate transport system permease protein